MKTCTIKGCNHPYYAKGFCNAHYIRARKGKNEDSPIRLRNQKGCKIKGCEREHVGRGLCGTHLAREKRRERWEELIKLKGGVCNICKNSFHFSCYDFHHIDPKKKEVSIGTQLLNCSIKDILEEVEKCELLCANCHRLHHYLTYNPLINNREKRKINVDIQKVDKDNVKMTYSNKLQAIEMRKQGKTLDEISRVFGVSASYIGAIILNKKKKY